MLKNALLNPINYYHLNATRTYRMHYYKNLPDTTIWTTENRIKAIQIIDISNSLNEEDFYTNVQTIQHPRATQHRGLICVDVWA